MTPPTLLRWLGPFLPIALLASPARADLVDIHGPVRLGMGYSAAFRGRVVAMSFEDEVSLHRLDGGTEIAAVFGMDAQRATRDAPGGKPRGFLGVDAGVAFLTRFGPSALIGGLTLGPAWLSGDDGAAPRAFGASARLELRPFHLPVQDALKCRRGIFYTYVLSGLEGWVQARHDWMPAASGPSLAAGLGLDLGNNVLLPIMARVAGKGCSRRDETEAPEAPPKPAWGAEPLGSPVRALP